MVNLLVDGIGVPHDEIFCSSLKGYGIPIGKNFVDWVKAEIEGPKLVILLLTPNYFTSSFCLCEMGAAWVKSHEIFPILVAPLTYEDLKGIHVATQAAKVDDELQYNQIRDYLGEVAGIKVNKTIIWDLKRKDFFNKLPGILKDLPQVKVVSESELESIKSELKEAIETVSEFSQELDEAKKRIVDLEALKDKSDVKELNKKSAKGLALEEAFDAITKDIKGFRSVLGSTAVFKFALCDHYGKPMKAELEYQDEFDAAVRRNFLLEGETLTVNWNNRKLSSLQDKLEELRVLFSGEKGVELSELLVDIYPDTPEEPDNEEFWHYHYL